MSEPAPPPAPDRVGTVGGLVRIVQSITLTQTLTIALLVMIAIPTYVLWRFMNDSSMLNKFTSFFEEISSEQSPCTVRIASQRGADPIYSISTGFAFQGSDRWNIGVILTHKPDDGEVISYCEVLNRIVDFMRRPDKAPLPTYPNSDEPLIWRYPPAASP